MSFFGEELDDCLDYPKIPYCPNELNDINNLNNLNFTNCLNSRNYLNSLNCLNSLRLTCATGYNAVKYLCIPKGYLTELCSSLSVEIKSRKKGEYTIVYNVVYLTGFRVIYPAFRFSTSNPNFLKHFTKYWKRLLDYYVYILIQGGIIL